MSVASLHTAYRANDDVQGWNRCDSRNAWPPDSQIRPLQPYQASIWPLFLLFCYLLGYPIVAAHHRWASGDLA
jgi:hypothetical protein